jgi:uncharacterized membrane protein YdjX (TVP38/TMEM64 family)
MHNVPFFSVLKHASLFCYSELPFSFDPLGGASFHQKIPKMADEDGAKLDDELAMMEHDYEEDDDDELEEEETEEEGKTGSQLRCILIIIIVFFILGLIDSLTTKFARRGSAAFAKWTCDNAPLSFLLYCFIIILLVALCLPYGPLSLFMGAIFTQLYGWPNGIYFGVLVLFTTTMVAAIMCFLLARHRFKAYVQKTISKNPKLKVLRNLDRLIIDGQGFEMVLLVRLAPFPTGPTHYFLGTTSVGWGNFLGGNAVTNFIFSCTDILIGAGASSLSTDNPLGIGLFVLGVVGFFGLMFYVGLRAKRKLDALDAEHQHVRRESIELEERDLRHQSRRAAKEAAAASSKSSSATSSPESSTLSVPSSLESAEVPSSED